ncbi:sodium:glutamate symporter [bacterium]|nr:sodium:glutamate symporter [bacterium]
MNFPWKFFLDLGVISIALLFATLLRTRIKFFQKYLIPNALTAGFMLLFFYNFVAKYVGMNNSDLGAMVYHLLSISFIAMSLRKAPMPRIKGDLGIFSTSVAIISQYAIQIIIGLLLTFFFMKTFFPSLFPSFGLFIPLGFALGPGQAYAIGQGWESFGFQGAGTVGLTFAAVGFIWACFGGMWLINYGIRKKWITEEKLKKLRQRNVSTGVYSKDKELPVGSHLTTETEAIDSLTYNGSMVLVVYLLSFLLLKLLTYLLSFAGQAGMELAVNLWGISFVFAALTALAFKGILNLLNIQHTLDNGCLTRISGISVDLMVSGAIAAISLVVVAQYWIPITVMCIIAGIAVMATVPWLCSRLFVNHRFERTLIIFGACTGTMPTGLALLRVIDPDFETPVASDYMFSSAVTFFIVIPLILSINLPAYSHRTGNPMYFWAMVGIGLIYLVFVLISFRLIAKKRTCMYKSKIWLHEYLIRRRQRIEERRKGKGESSNV